MPRERAHGQIFRAANGEWTWHIRAAGNHEIIFGGQGETYENLGDLEELVYNWFPSERVMWVNLDHFHKEPDTRVELEAGQEDVA